MRLIFDPTNGSNVTSTVQAYLQSGGAPVTAFLYSWQTWNFWDYNPYGSYATFCFTDFEDPLLVSYMQLYSNPVATALGAWGDGGLVLQPLPFTAENISLDKLSYGIGFEDRPVEVTWAPTDGRNNGCLMNHGSVSPSSYWTAVSNCAYPTNLSLKQAFTYGLFTECPFYIHKAYFTDFPRLGGSFLGTSLMFRGYVRKTVTSQSTLKISLASLMDLFQSTQIPTQTITPNNRTLPYVPLAVSPYNDGGIFSHYSTPVFLAPTVLQINTTYSIPTNALQDSWINFNPAAYAGSGFSPVHSGFPTCPSFRIQGNTAGPGTIQIYFYEPYAFPGTYGGFNIWAQQTTTGGVAQGFLYVPPPEFSA